MNPAAPPSSHAFEALASRVDLSDNHQIQLLMELVGALSRATDPIQVQRTFAEGVRRLHPIDAYIGVSVRGLPPGQYKITRTILRSDEAFYGGKDPWSSWHEIPAHTGGIIGEIIRSAYPELLQNLRIENDPVLGDLLAPFGSLMAIPLFDNGEPLNWAISLRRAPNGFTMAHLEESILRSNLVGGTVRNTLNMKLLRQANERIRAEMERIAAIQRSLLPEGMPAIPGVTVSASYATYDSAGGDLYGFRPLLAESERHAAPPESPWGILIADASGHGPSAAVVSAMLHAIVHAYPRPPESTAAMMEHVNRHLAAKRIENSFVTAFFAIYDPATRRLQYTRAGHEPPLVKNAGSGQATTRLEDGGGIPLGIVDDATYEQAETVLEPGQTLVLYTDGITEARDPRGGFFGLEGIERALVACSGEPDCVVNSITTALRAHEAGVRPQDDQTIVALKVHGT
ncbi:MAG: serine/threonine-protein phosphatase [Phycisphaerales bacterium]|nr:serine/threonine-protein phosphatase [Phycisphaerales bacterium]